MNTPVQCLWYCAHVIYSYTVWYWVSERTVPCLRMSHYRRYCMVLKTILSSVCIASRHIVSLKSLLQDDGDPLRLAQPAASLQHGKGVVGLGLGGATHLPAYGGYDCL